MSTSYNVLSSKEMDSWANLQTWTDARIALGRAGTSLTTRTTLDFQLDYARAKDAVKREWDNAELKSWLSARGERVIEVSSRARDKSEYLRRPDFGRLLDDASTAALDAASGSADSTDVCVVVGDGLSSLAVERQAVPFLADLLPALDGLNLRRSPVVLVQRARVAIADDVASRLGSKMSFILIGERPGLSSPDSLGVYFTFAPRVGLQNADRNCISNIRPAGLSYADAARQCVELALGAMKLGISGVNLKVGELGS